MARSAEERSSLKEARSRSIHQQNNSAQLRLRRAAKMANKAQREGLLKLQAQARGVTPAEERAKQALQAQQLRDNPPSPPSRSLSHCL